MERSASKKTLTNKKQAIKKNIAPKNNFPEYNHQIKYAFTCGDIDYFQFADFNNMPPLRSLKTLVFYEEMRMKCTVEYLKWHAEANDNLLTKDKINIFEIKKLNDQLKQRIAIAVDFEILFKIASIIFFDKDEDFRDYDFGYNARKIAHWKKYQGVAFFLNLPLQELLPILKDLDGNLEIYFKVISQMNEKHMENLLQNLPEGVRSKLKGSSYFNAMVMPQG